jgi:phosphoribosylanthranilate isomerase
MVGYGIDKDNVGSWIDNTHILGICLKGSIEVKPGFKDYDELADILEMLEVD